MTKTKNSTFFENKLLDFIAEPNPLFSMMQWLTEQLMEIEVSKIANAPKVYTVPTGRRIDAERDSGVLIPVSGQCTF